MLIPAEHLPHFERSIYLPLVLKVLELDRQTVETSAFKLQRPYIKLIDAAIKAVQTDLKETKAYMRENSLKITRDNNDATTTDYTFFYGGYSQLRRYLNVRLRNRTEEQLEMYLMKT